MKNNAKQTKIDENISKKNEEFRKYDEDTSKEYKKSKKYRKISKRYEKSQIVGNTSKKYKIENTNKAEDTVDILLTTYNTEEKYLIKQIDSILNQTYKNFKLIISDDCSKKSNTKEILKKYKEKDKRIELYFQEKNLGYTKNFEFLLKNSNSNYIAFCDHDDIWYSNKIEKELNILKQKKVDLVYCDANQIDENDKILHKSYLRYKHMPILNKKYKKILPFARHIAIGCSQLFTKNVKDIMIPFTKNVMAHDWISLYIASRLKGIYCIDEPLFGYRIHGDNAFGGRNFKQNMKIWKKENGNNYNSYLKYRHKVITETYLAGVLMCEDYSDKIAKYKEKFDVNGLQSDENEQKLLNEQNCVIKYFKNAQKHKIIYWSFHKYFKYLYFCGMKTRKFKEIGILHFPLIGYLVFKMK